MSLPKDFAKQLIENQVITNKFSILILSLCFQKLTDFPLLFMNKEGLRKCKALDLYLDEA